MEFWQGELSKQDEISEKSLDQSLHLMMKKLSHRDRDDLPKFGPSKQKQTLELDLISFFHISHD